MESEIRKKSATKIKKIKIGPFRDLTQKSYTKVEKNPLKYKKDKFKKKTLKMLTLALECHRVISVVF